MFLKLVLSFYALLLWPQATIPGPGGTRMP